MTTDSTGLTPTQNHNRRQYVQSCWVTTAIIAVEGRVGTGSRSEHAYSAAHTSATLDYRPQTPPINHTLGIDRIVPAYFSAAACRNAASLQ